jgi:hypothetical protein
MEFKIGSSHGAARVLHNIQPLSPSNGILLKALRVGNLAERNAADVEWIRVMVAFNHETEGQRRYRVFAETGIRQADDSLFAWYVRWRRAIRTKEARKRRANRIRGTRKRLD